MIKYTKIILLACLPVTGLFFPASAADWRNYTLKDGQFMIELPGEVTEESETFQSEIYGELLRHQLTWEGEGYTFQVSYTDYPDWIFHQVTIGDFLAEEEMRLSEQFRGDISYSTVVKIHNYPGRSFLTNIGETGRQARVQFYIVRNRLYTLIARSHKSGIYSYFVSNFFESFKMAPAEVIPELQDHLNNLGYEYKINEDGRYKFTLFLTEQRSQMVFIVPTELEITPDAQYYIWSPVTISDELPDLELANELLYENSKMEIGSFQLVKIEEGFLLFVAATIHQGQDLESFQRALFELIRKADNFELKVTHKDEY